MPCPKPGAGSLAPAEENLEAAAILLSAEDPAALGDTTVARR
ncbi:hypothetical protein OG883_09100 [Streptomyces sp. NBC_01142]|nr:hypothetical protein [Streptomyces sp. NBC_01142]MCX4820057.1 hypothetical protein [Streptomyces sp. NBC_01142]